MSLEAARQDEKLLSDKRRGEKLSNGFNVLSWDCGTRNLAYCLLEACEEPDESEFRILMWENLDLQSDSVASAVQNLQRELDARQWMLAVDNVCIESQVTPNTTMKVISHCIQMYFAAKLGGSASIHFVSPKQKFKVCNVPEPTDCPAPGHAKNKKIAVLMARKLLCKHADKSMIQYVQSFDKQDDLCDAFLQGLYFIRMTKQKLSSLQRISRIMSGDRTITVEPDAPREDCLGRASVPISFRRKT